LSAPNRCFAQRAVSERVRNRLGDGDGDGDGKVEVAVHSLGEVAGAELGLVLAHLLA